LIVTQLSEAVGLAEFSATVDALEERWSIACESGTSVPRVEVADDSRAFPMLIDFDSTLCSMQSRGKSGALVNLHHLCPCNSPDALS